MFFLKKPFTNLVFTVILFTFAAYLNLESAFFEHEIHCR